MKKCPLLLSISFGLVICAPLASAQSRASGTYFPAYALPSWAKGPGFEAAKKWWNAGRDESVLNKKEKRAFNRLKKRAKIGAIISAIILIGGVGHYIARKKNLLPTPGKRPKTIPDEKFLTISKQPMPPAAMNFLKKALTERNDDALALFWIVRSSGPGRSGTLPGFGATSAPSAPLIKAVESINYPLAKDVLELTITASGSRSKSNEELIARIMDQKGNDPLFQIADLLANAGWFKMSYPPLTHEEAERKTKQILQNIDKDDVSRLKKSLKNLLNINPALYTAKKDYSAEGAEASAIILHTLAQWVKQQA